MYIKVRCPKSNFETSLPISRQQNKFDGWAFFRGTKGGVVGEQCDQIGRIFADWAIIYHGHFLKFTEAAEIFALLISHVNSYVPINFDKTCAGIHFGRFFHKKVWSPCWRKRPGLPGGLF
jgi:hypothetical protein